MLFEDGVGEVGAAAYGKGGQHRLRFFQLDVVIGVTAEDGDEQFDFGLGALFVQRDADAVGIYAAQVVARFQRALHDGVRT